MSRLPSDPLRCRPPGTHPRVLLPWRGQVGVFTVEPPELELIASIPAEGPGRFRLCESGCHVLVLDRDGQRLRVFALDAGGEPVELALPTLPSGRIDDLLMAEGVIYVGGLVEGVPMVWSHHCLYAHVLGDGDPGIMGWNQLPMPELGGPHGKSVDLLFWRHGDLIAVDDIVYPRWNLVFDVRDPHFSEHLATVLLPTHNSYEQVHTGALGSRYLALYSSGVNRGNHSFHLSILCAESQRERTCYTAWVPGGRVSARTKPSPLADLRRLAFGGDVLYALSGTETLLRYDLRGDPLPMVRGARRGLADSDAPEGPAPTQVVLQRVRTALHLASLDARGVVVMGLDGDGRECTEWVAVDRP
jgi:hypothetical protein